MRTSDRPESRATVAVIGAGAWGTAVAALIAENHPGTRVRLWAYEKQVARSIATRSVNTLYLPGITLPKNLDATHSLREALDDATTVIIATPSKAVYETCKRAAAHLREGAHVGFLSKGFCKMQGRVFTISETIAVALPGAGDRIAAISGPTHAEEVTARFHSCISIGSPNRTTRRLFSRLLSCPQLQCRETDDLRGVELGGTLKNPAAIAAGMISVLPGCGDNLAGALIAESMKEILRIGKALGGREETLIDISGLGDLVATALSTHSRNRRFGRDIATRILKGGRPLGLFDRAVLFFRPGRVMERMTERLHYLAEGAYAIEPLIEIAARLGVALPLYRSLYEVLLNRKDPGLLVETIKDPRRFEELYERAALQPLLSGRDVRNQPGRAFRKPVLDALARSLGDTPDRSAAIERASGMFERMADRYGLIWSFFAFALLRVIRLLSATRGADIIAPVTAIRARDGVLRGGMAGFTPVYVMPSAPDAMAAGAVFALRRAGMPAPRFWLEDRPGGGPLATFLLRKCGGFFVNSAGSPDITYRGLIAAYCSFLVSHGIPVMLRSSGREGAGTGNSITLLGEVLGSIIDTREPVLFYPLTVTPGDITRGRGGLELRIGAPVASTDAAEPAALLEELALRI